VAAGITLDQDAEVGWGCGSVVECLPSITRLWVRSPALEKNKKAGLPSYGLEKFEM
jgi:hypothetical protein